MFHLNEVLNNLATSSGFSDIIRNPIYTAVIIVFIIMLIAYFMIRSKWNSSICFWKIFIKLSLYAVIGTMLVMYLHNREMVKNFREHYTDNSNIKMVDATSGADIKELNTPQETKYIPPVVPKPAAIPIPQPVIQQRVHQTYTLQPVQPVQPIQQLQ